MKKLLVGFLTLVLIGLVTKAHATPLPPALEELLKRDPVMLLWSGTGFFITSDGYALTNCHVACKGSVNYTALFNNSIHKIKFVRQVAHMDVALIKVELKPGEQVVPLALASRDPELGEKVTIIGYPIPEDTVVPPSVTFGTVTRAVYQGSFSVDANIFPGNSGSPVLDSDNAVIGIAYGVRQSEEGLMLGYNLAFPFSIVTKDLKDVKYNQALGYSLGIIDVIKEQGSDLSQSVFMVQAWGHVSVVLKQDD